MRRIVKLLGIIIFVILFSSCLARLHGVSQRPSHSGLSKESKELMERDETKKSLILALLLISASFYIMMKYSDK